MSGKPFKPFDWPVLNALLQRGASMLACTEIMGISEDTIARHIRKEYDLTFAEYREKKLQKTVLKLVEKAIDKALSGDNTMLIWTMKNLAGWADKNETLISEVKPIQLKYSLQETKDVITQAVQETVKEKAEEINN
jgi:hypothetical protein